MTDPDLDALLWRFGLFCVALAIVGLAATVALLAWLDALWRTP